VRRVTRQAERVGRGKQVKKTLRYAFGIIFFLLTSAVCGALAQTPEQCVALNSTAVYAENFDSLVSAGTGSMPPPAGFSLSENGAGADNLYTANNGFSHLGDTYSYGSRDSNERALGVKTSGSVTLIQFGGCFTNNTSLTLDSVVIQYAGEQWRGGTTGADTLVFEYSTNAESLTAGTYVRHSALNFSSIIHSGGGSLDGNAAGNRLFIRSSIPVTLAPGKTFWIRWSDSNTLGSDDGLAVDDLFLMPVIGVAKATITGQIKDSGGRGLSRVTVTVAGGSLNRNLTTRTNAFGYYRFNDVPVGETYTVSVLSKSYSFPQSSLILNLTRNESEIDFIGRYRWE
jgi:hypothetical protein